MGGDPIARSMLRQLDVTNRLVGSCHRPAAAVKGVDELSTDVRTGKRIESDEHFTTAPTLYREMDMRFRVEKAEAEMRELA